MNFPVTSFYDHYMQQLIIILLSFQSKFSESTVLVLSLIVEYGSSKAEDTNFLLSQLNCAHAMRHHFNVVCNGIRGIYLGGAKSCIRGYFPMQCMKQGLIKVISHHPRHKMTISCDQCTVNVFSSALLAIVIVLLLCTVIQPCSDLIPHPVLVQGLSKQFNTSDLLLL